MKFKHKTKGFTLIEMLTVLLILAIASAIAAPSMIGFLTEGQRIENNNVARAIYLAAQSELSDMQRSGGLKEFTKDFYKDDIYSDDNTKIDPSTQAPDLPIMDPNEKPEYIHYIVSEIVSEGAADTNSKVYKLLEKNVVDLGILAGSISIEFNIKTGKVRGVFYSPRHDNATKPVVELNYAEAATDTDGNLANVDNRKKLLDTPGTYKIGYYGVDTTGKLPPLTPEIAIYDGVENGKTLDGSAETVDSMEKNVLYVEMFIPKELATDGTFVPSTKKFDVEIVSKNEGRILHSLDNTTALSVPTTGGNVLNEALISDGDIIYRPTAQTKISNKINVSDSYDRVIWVLDAFYNAKNASETDLEINTFDRQKHSIAVKYPLIKGDIKAKISKSTEGTPPSATSQLNIVSSNFANAYFDSTVGNVNIVKSARHLNNIRYGETSGNYRQMADINMQNINMAPLTYKYDGDGKLVNTETAFTGDYTAVNADYGKQTSPIKDKKLYQIDKLRIEAGTTVIPNTGLFGKVEKNTIASLKGNITGVSLNNASITANGGNVGSIVGEFNGGTLSLSNSFANVKVVEDPAVNAGTKVNAGGLVGSLLDKGIVETSYNGGFYDAANTPPKPEKDFGSVIVTGNNYTDVTIGGLVGSSAGKIQNSYNNARVNIESVTIGTAADDKGLSLLHESPQTSYPTLGMATGKIAYIGGIVGNNIAAASNSLENTYATNYVGKTTLDADGKTGGIVGTGNAGTNNLFILNGSNGEKATSKLSLKKMEGDKFTATTGYPENPARPLDTTAKNYPYPQLNNNKHITFWEDIKEKTSARVDLKYYETYTGAETLVKTELLDGENIVSHDGYCLEFEYAKFTLKIDDKKYALEDTANSDRNPTWKWKTDTGYSSDLALPIKIEGSGENPGSKPKYRLFLNNSVLEEIAKSGNYIKIQVLQGGENGTSILNGSSKKDETATDVYFNPLFAQAILIEQSTEPPEAISYIVRSPRHIDNVDKALDKTFVQKLNMDFASYRRELTITGNTVTLPANDNKIPTNAPVVNGDFTGIYDGENHFIKNVVAKNGVFKTIAAGGRVEQIALLQSSFTGNDTVGSIAGTNNGYINRCEVSEILVKSDATAGGIVGTNAGTISNVYFNSTHRNEDGVYASPVSGGNNAKVGGLIGENTAAGTLTNAYTTAVGPTAVGPTAVGPNKKPTVGAGTVGAHVYYLNEDAYNPVAVGDTQGTPKTPIALAELAALQLGGDWEVAIEDTTKDTDGIYPFPKITGMNHHYDWPILNNTLKYYEVYSNGDKGYFYYIDKKTPRDSLKYNTDLTVVEEGYLVDLVNTGTYNVLLGGEENDMTIKGTKGELFDTRLVIKLNDYHDPESSEGGTKDYNAIIETVYSLQDNVFNLTGMLAMKIQIKEMSIDGAKNILYGDGVDGFVYYNPFFAKEIYLENATDQPAPQKKLEVRSPRQMMHINGKTLEAFIADKSGVTFDRGGDLKTYNYRQTINIDFTQAKRTEGKDKNENKYYINEAGDPLPQIGRNVIAGFIGTYDGSYDGRFPNGAIDEKTGRAPSNKIFNLVMNVKGKATGSAFGNLGSTSDTSNYLGSNQVTPAAAVKNLEFVDPQIRYAAGSDTQQNGLGGGIVANVNYGTIDNVKVYNDKEKRSLFTRADGQSIANFCASTDIVGNGIYGHAHGGIAAASFGSSKITNCFVGTNTKDSTSADMAANQTQIVCTSTKTKDDEEKKMVLVGGIVGALMDNQDSLLQPPKVIACTNAATIKATGAETSRINAGGIVGRVGNSSGQNGHGEIIGSYNAGSIEVKNGGWIGGITGRANGPSKVMSCYNTGRVNVKNNAAGNLEKVGSTDKTLRISGIVSEINTQATFSTCYNIGYVSDVVGGHQSSAAGAILGLVAYGNVTMTDCFSLAADRYRPSGIVGKYHDNNATVNGKPITAFTRWETREDLRNNEELVTEDSDNPYPFNPPTGYYTYPQLENFTVDGVPYKNPHTTPWESIDAIYDGSLKYYEKYAAEEEGKSEEYAYYSLNLRGEVEENLQERTIVDDGYFIEFPNEITEGVNYKIMINEQAFDNLKPAMNCLETEKLGIKFTEEMKKACTPGYNKIKVFTMLPTGIDEDTKYNEAYNKVNRLIGSTTTSDANSTGLDFYFDYLFPREIKIADTAVTKETLNPQAYTIRSPRHLDNIGKLTVAEGNKTIDKVFNQELDIDFSKYTGAITDFDPTTKIFSRSIVQGEFKGTYNGNYKTLSNAKISGEADKGNIGLFETNRGTIQNLKLNTPVYSSALTAGNANLNMGTIAGQNHGTIETSAIVHPSLTGTTNLVEQNIGGIAGTNTNAIKDVYLVAKDTAAESPITVNSSKEGTGTKNLGGLVGDNTGSIDHSLYLAKAPTDKHPITGTNTGDVNKENVFYLLGTDYNDFDPLVGVEGTPKSKSALESLELESWNQWGRVETEIEAENYPYPSLTNIAPPSEYPTPAAINYTLAYYEQYNDDSTVWYFYDTNKELRNTLKTIAPAKTGYAVLAPAKDDDYTLRINEEEATPTDLKDINSPITGLEKVIELPSNIEDLLATPTDLKPHKVTLNGFEMENGYTYYEPNFAKAIYNTPDGLPIRLIRTIDQFKNINSIPDATGLTFVQEENLDFKNIPLDNAVITTDFKGTFDGNNKNISNLTIESEGDNVGVFAQNNGTIKNLSLNFSINITGNTNVGGIAGKNGSTGIIENSKVEQGVKTLTGATNIYAKGSNVGGIAGENENIIKNSTVKEVIISGEKTNVGGIVGSNLGLVENTAVKNTTITGKRALEDATEEDPPSDNVGGIAGSSIGKDAKIATIDKASVIDTSISGANNVGGVVGYAEGIPRTSTEETTSTNISKVFYTYTNKDQVEKNKPTTEMVNGITKRLKEEPDDEELDEEELDEEEPIEEEHRSFGGLVGNLVNGTLSNAYFAGYVSTGDAVGFVKPTIGNEVPKTAEDPSTPTVPSVGSLNVYYLVGENFNKDLSKNGYVDQGKALSSQELTELTAENKPFSKKLAGENLWVMLGTDPDKYPYPLLTGLIVPERWCAPTALPALPTPTPNKTPVINPGIVTPAPENQRLPETLPFVPTEDENRPQTDPTPETPATENPPEVIPPTENPEELPTEDPEVIPPTETPEEPPTENLPEVIPPTEEPEAPPTENPEAPPTEEPEQPPVVEPTPPKKDEVLVEDDVISLTSKLLKSPKKEMVSLLSLSKNR